MDKRRILQVSLAVLLGVIGLVFRYRRLLFSFWRVSQVNNQTEQVVSADSEASNGNVVTPADEQQEQSQTAESQESDESAQATPKAQPFETPLTPAQPRVPAVANLLPSSNPNQRVQQVEQGRADPFALIPVKPGEAVVSITFDDRNGSTISSGSRIPSVPPPPSGNNGSGVNQVPFNPGITASKPSTALKPKSSTGVANNSKSPTGVNTGNQKPPTGVNRGTPVPFTPFNTPRSVSGLPPAPSANNAGINSGSSRFIPQLPAIPKPQLAQAVEVTGVIEVQGVPHAIIKAPNERLSRHVKAGQYIANGQVLIKRIEMNGAPEPVVIFEQLGMEVSKGVGEKAISL